MSQPIDHPDTSQPSAHTLPPELPPVEPPTAGFIVQLFVIPAVVVAVVIAVWLLFGKLAGGERSALDYVETIRSENYLRRWRAAYELSSLIRNDPKLANDPVLLGALTELLDQELPKPDEAELKQYLALTLGAFQTLDAPAQTGRPLNPLGTLAATLDPQQPVQARIAAAWALDMQGNRLEGQLENAQVATALIAASQDEDPQLRQMAVNALAYVQGPEAHAALRAHLKDENRIARYNAATGLARRGDAAALPVLREMLSSQDLDQVLTAETTSEKRNQIESIELVALKSLQTKEALSLARQLQPEIRGLIKSGLISVRLEAESLLKRLPDSLP
jgi:hypothetical protein